MTTLPQERSVEQWVEHFREKWKQFVDETVQSYAELGTDFIRAKKSVQHGEWLKLLEQLPFDKQTAQRMMRISRFLNDETVIEIEKTNAVKLLELLPPDQIALDQIAQLARLKPDAFNRLIGQKRITPNLRRNELKRILNMEKVDADRRRIANLRPRPGKYKTIVADPAWEYETYSESVNATAEYARQSMEELRALNIKNWAEPDCHLWCWTTDGYIEKALELVRHWGFEYRQMLVWIKPHFGRGQFMRTATEHVLFCTLGNLPPKTHDIPTYFHAPPDRHSEKPEEFYDIVRKMCWEPFCEFNGRQFRQGFSDAFMVGDLLRPSGEPLQEAV